MARLFNSCGSCYRSNSSTSFNANNSSIDNPAGGPAVLRVREGGEIADLIELDTQAYAVMLGGPERRHLFISTSDTHDPAEMARAASATLRVVEVDVPGAGIP
jgi:sugar lactone lactonase YvrE